MQRAFKGTYQERPVLVTGHTGFKGSWLSIWLKELGAEVVGYALEPPSSPSNFDVSRIATHIHDIRGDVTNIETLCKTMEYHRPEIVFHLAAQAIVRESYQDPKTTMDANVGGTVNVLEAIRRSPSVKVAILITTDKCYQNQEWDWGYRENDPLGGHDPYSASKAMAELAISAYRDSFFKPTKSGRCAVAVASVRAGNVIGGGDWGRDRIVPDAMTALFQKRVIEVRNPVSIRPWQYVLEPLSGYLWLAARLLASPQEADAWNFGPSNLDAIAVEELVERIISLWGEGSWRDVGSHTALRETGVLRLNWEKAAQRLKWHPVYGLDSTLEATIHWYRHYYNALHKSDMYPLCVEQIRDYTMQARQAGLAWAN